MLILIACECSGIVREAFAKKGHEVWSCDIKPSEIPGKHLQEDVLNVAYEGWWDLIIAHPPCTYLSFAGVAHWNKPGRAELRERGLAFFMALVNAPCEKICVENPVGVPNREYRKPDQIVHPYFFGNPFLKRTCLWLKGLPLLTFSEENKYKKPVPAYSHLRKPSLYYTGTEVKHRYFVDSQSRTQTERSRTFTGIAEAMAEQWNF